MKVRSFYPRQVLRRLQGEHKQLDAGQVAAIRYMARKGRKLGLSIAVGSTANLDNVLAAGSAAAAQAIIIAANTCVSLTGDAFAARMP